MCLKPRGARLIFQGNSAWAKYRSGSGPWSFFVPQPHGNPCYAGYSQGDQSQKLHSGSFCSIKHKNMTGNYWYLLLWVKKVSSHAHKTGSFFKIFGGHPCHFIKLYGSLLPPPGGEGVWLALPNKSCSQLFPKGNDIMRAKPRHFMQTAVVFIA